MKNFKKIVGGGTRLIVLALLFSMMLSVPTFATEVGDTVSYRSDAVASADRFYVKDYDGLCCYWGGDVAASGTGRVERKVSNSSAFAKVAYHYAYKKGWLDNTDIYDNGLEKGKCLQYLLQVGNMGWSDWRSATSISESSQNLIKDLWDVHSDLSNAPDNFEMFVVNPGSGYQPFVIMTDDATPPEGKLCLKKASANTGITG